MRFTLETRKNGYNDFSVTGAGVISRICLPLQVKKGDLFNVYTSTGKKYGCTWNNNTELSLQPIIDKLKLEEAEELIIQVLGHLDAGRINIDLMKQKLIQAAKNLPLPLNNKLSKYN